MRLMLQCDEMRAFDRPSCSKAWYSARPSSMVGIVRVLFGRWGSRTFFTSSGEIESRSSQTARWKRAFDLLIELKVQLPIAFAFLVDVGLHHRGGDARSGAPSPSLAEDARGSRGQSGQDFPPPFGHWPRASARTVSDNVQGIGESRVLLRDRPAIGERAPEIMIEPLPLFLVGVGVGDLLPRLFAS